MKNCAIIAEYNPFHNGHLLHINQTKRLTECGHIIAIMSGNFVQRGEPAICGKFLRTRMALMAGIGIVLEIPLPFASASAGYFAESAVKIAHASGIVDMLSFGSETGEISVLQNCLTLDGRIHSPNDILALEYMRSLKNLRSDITPFTIKRTGGGYNETGLTGALSSATAIRNSLANGTTNLEYRTSVPEFVSEELENASSEHTLFMGYADYFQIIRYKIMSMSASELSDIHEVCEGLENRIIASLPGAKTLDELILRVKSKRYAYSRIRRILLNIFLGLDKKSFAAFRRPEAGYIRVLGFRRDAAPLLGELVEKAALPVVTNLKHAKSLLNDEAQRLLSFELRGTDMYNSLLTAHRKKDYEKSQPLVIL